MKDYLEFEKPIRELDERIEKLAGAAESRPSAREEIRKLKARLAQTETELYERLTPWQRTQLAPHQQRPTVLDYVRALCSEFIELHGDRTFGDDPAIVGGLARFGGHTVMVLGTQKGKTLKERMHRNFGMPNPEGYRKALRLMKLAEKFTRPIVTFIDTPGAYPGIGAEERGQAEAIARNLLVLSRLRVPILSVVIGEGGSGGALALGVSDRALMLEHAIYSVISPEGCAAILWKDATQRERAARALKLTAEDLSRLEVVDEILPEPPGGGHVDSEAMSATLADAVRRHLSDLSELDGETLVQRRAAKFRAMGPLLED